MPLFVVVSPAGDARVLHAVVEIVEVFMFHRPENNGRHKVTKDKKSADDQCPLHNLTLANFRKNTL